MLKEYEKTVSNMQKLIDAITVSLCWWGAFYIRFQYMQGGQQGLELDFLKLNGVLIVSTIYFFRKYELYASQRFSSKFKELWNLVRANLSSTLTLVILIYFFDEERFSRLTILLYFLISCFVLILVRLGVRNYLRHLRTKGKNLRHVLLVGNGESLLTYIDTARKFKDSGIRFSGWIDSNGRNNDSSIPSISEDYSDYKKSNHPDCIILCYDGEKSSKSHDFMAKHYSDLIPIMLLPNLGYSLVGHQIEDFGGTPLITVNQPRYSTFEYFLKRLLDILGTFIGGILISPLLLFLAIGVKTSSPGPILFGQRRMGIKGNQFLMWKFRTMRVAEKEVSTQEWSNKDNPRKTKFGDFLRRTSLDELPQIWNVFVGDMSLVGPRPEQPFFVEKFRHEIPGYMLRHKMRAGITGWAQVNGWRGDTDLNKRLECDIYYIKHWSFWFDIKILFATIFKGFLNKNAY